MNRRTLTWAIVITTALVAVSLFLPWATSGEVSRSGWELATTAARLEVAGTGWGRLVLGAFFLIPAGAFATLTAGLSGRRWLIALPSGTTVVVSAWGAAVVATSPLEVRWGLTLNLVACATDVVLTLLLRTVGR
ncbi:MAG: hypothetical protein P8N02_12555 [Actinomycetota bacterium]|nr:hypothetical protein [Actinomycetota bacterium]